MFENIDYRDYQGQFTPPETLFVHGLTACDHCHAAIAMLKERNIAFKYLFLDALGHESRGVVLRELKRRAGPRLVFPVAVAGETTLAGYDPDRWTEELHLPA